MVLFCAINQQVTQLLFSGAGMLFLGCMQCVLEARVVGLAEAIRMRVRKLV